MMFASGDPDLAAFIAASGASDTAGISALVAYLKAESLWTSSRFFPFKSAQNKGSGTTVFGLGGWTSNNVDLVNGPTWGVNGVAFDATDDRATWEATGIAGLSDLIVFDVQRPLAASSPDVNRFGLWSVGNVAAANTRFFVASTVTGSLAGETTCLAVTVTSADVRRAGASGITWGAGEKTQLVAKLSATGFGIWKGKTAATLNLTVGTQNFAPSQAGFSTNSILHLNAISDLSNSTFISFAATTRVALLLCKTTLTDAQRETITDLIDAL
jgi:hypothetical protein